MPLECQVHVCVCVYGIIRLEQSRLCFSAICNFFSVVVVIVSTCVILDIYHTLKKIINKTKNGQLVVQGARQNKKNKIDWNWQSIRKPFHVTFGWIEVELIERFKYINDVYVFTFFCTLLGDKFGIIIKRFSTSKYINHDCFLGSVKIKGTHTHIGD